ncbi:AraC family transcriptional regulator [Clostridium oryzae]|uniref:HTH-type transcriptional activator RhaS n=1 Tax=Clostridium oryzae TaxID=1450648 RepID=A0A1V4IJL4_9CLOT|nr:AraC family transcriptional regulator [Clostridium oryzae]OPJ60126.1 HTH-type transcriptional activator RhaS [Clostridium oryzae]
MCCNFGMDVDNFNPKILYTFEKRFEPSHKSKVHSHDFMSIIYIMSGNCTYMINNIPYKVKKGDILVLNPGVCHGKYTIDGSGIHEFHAGFENFKVNDLPNNNIINDNITPVIPYTNYDDDLLQCFNDIILEQNKNESGSELILKTLGMKLLVILLRVIYQNNSIKEKGCINFETYDRSTIVNAITEFINTNYMHDLSLEIISQNMYLSPAYISKLFKEETGDSPINYLIKIRLSKAKDFLTYNRLTIKEAAHAVGYDDAYHFSKLFKKHYGYPPSCLKYKAV